MNDYSDIFFLLGAMMVFTLLSTDISQRMVRNDKILSDSEVEYSGVALAKGLIDRAQWATSKSQLDPDKDEFLFANYKKDNPKKEVIKLGSSNQYEVDYDIYVIVSDTSTSSAINKKITVGVTSDYLTDKKNLSPSEYPIKLEFIKSFSE